MSDASAISSSELGAAGMAGDRSITVSRPITGGGVTTGAGIPGDVVRRSRGGSDAAGMLRGAIPAGVTNAGGSRSVVVRGSGPDA